MVMPHTLWKNILRLIKTTKSRFFSLMAIVMIGTAFFIGVYSSSTIMAASVDAYDDAYALRDIQIFSDYGFSEDDVKAVEALPDIKKAEGEKFVDVIAANDSDTYTTRIHSYDKDAKIDRFKLVEGRLPEKPGEVLAEHGTPVTEVFPIGTKVRLSRPDDDLKDFIDRDEVTVVGLVDTPVYLNYSKENSTLRNTSIKTYLYMPEENFTIDRILSISAITQDGASYDSFSDAYDTYSEGVKQEVRTLADERQKSQFADIKQKALDQYHDGLREYRENEENFQKKIHEAEQKLENSAKQLEDGKAQVQQAEKELADGRESLASAEQEGRKKLEEGKKQLDAGWQKLTEAEDKLAGLDEQRDDLAKMYQDTALHLVLLQQAMDMLAYMPQEAGMAAIAEDLHIDLSVLDQIVPDWREKTCGALLTSLQQLQKQAEDGLSAMEMGLMAMDEGAMASDPQALQEQKDVWSSYHRIVSESVPLQKENTLLSCIAAMPGEVRDLRLGYFTVFYGSLQEVKDLYAPEDPILYGRLGDFLVQAEQDLAEKKAQEPEELKWQAMYEGVRIFHTYAPSSLQDMSMVVLQAAHGILPDVASVLGLDPHTTTFGTLQDQSIQRFEANSAVLQEKKNAVQAGQEAQKQRFHTHYDSLQSQLHDTEDLLTQKQAELEQGTRSLEEGLAAGRKQLADGEASLKSARQKLVDGEIQLQNGRDELNKQKREGQQKLDDAHVQLVDAKKQIDDMKAGEWTVLSRKQHYASVTFSQTIDQMAAIGKIFPVFFLMVAILVCMTTMARTVDEQRTEIGVLRALGYTRAQCTAKYLLYAGIATVIGELIGAAVGIVTFPVIIYSTWKMMYILPEIILVMDWKMLIITDIAFLAVMLLTTWFTCRQDMNEVPSQLLRPKAPKLGKNMLLEKISPIWRHISFTWKVTIRNLFRDKKRFILTVIGVAGCTALLVTGFGIRDSITGMVSVQYDELTKYDGLADIEDTLSNTDVTELERQIKASQGVEKVEEIYGYNSETFDENDNAVSISVQIFQDNAQARDAYVLRTRKGKKPVTLGDDGVVLTEKTAEILGLHVGDTFRIEDEEGDLVPVKIAAITEMHINHYCFMSDAYYQKVTGKEPVSRMLLITGNDLGDLQKQLASTEGVSGVTFFETSLGAFNTMIDSLDIIVWTIIISSMALAFVVLGNLINVNISERQREIATLKVLGFHHQEVQSYIYKENNVLTLCGALAGIPLGIWLHHTIMLTVEMDYVMFGREVTGTSIVLAVLLTIVFGILVNFAMRKKLRSIKMVESLKSVE